MIMANGDGDGGSQRIRKRAASHPWNHHEQRLNSTADRNEPRCCKVTMTVTRSEFRNIRARAGGKSVSEFLRQHVPAAILKPLPEAN